MALDPSLPLPDISPDAPAGPNLEFDAAFTEFERLSIGKPEQQYGSTVVPAEEPEWKDVVAAGWALLERAYDLRVMAQLAVARLQREGLPGYAATLELIRQVLETRWAAVHPQLDPDDDNDPTLRANALLAIGSARRVLRYLRDMPLARPRGGSVCWRDIAITAGQLEPEADYEKMTEAVFAGLFRETDPAGLSALRAAVTSAIGSVVAIPAAFDDQAGFGTGPDFTELLRLLRDIGSMMDRYTAAPAIEEDAAVDGDADAPGPEAGVPAAVARTAAVSTATLGPVNSRADAMRLLDLVVAYYERNEPSSPLPLLIGRARRLADMGFLDLMRDLAPDGVQQVQRIIGGELDSG